MEKQFINVAASQIGVKESPAGSNKVKYAKWYGMNGQPWCDMFVSWCGAQIGAESIVGHFAYCPSHVNWFKQKGWWLDRSAKPQPGDIVFFSNGSRPCHVGIVEKRIDNSYIQTIEGNTSISSNDNGGCVMRRRRTYGTKGSSWYIVGFGRPKWSEINTNKSTSKSETTKPTTKPTTNKPTTSSTSKLAVDGVCGANTVKAWQKVMGTTADGVISGQSKATKKNHEAITAVKYSILKRGSDLVRAVQKKLGVKVDGLMGPETVKAIQKHLGVTADGYFGKNTTKALQKRLNEGKF